MLSTTTQVKAHITRAHTRTCAHAHMRTRAHSHIGTLAHARMQRLTRMSRALAGPPVFEFSDDCSIVVNEDTTT